MDTQSRLPLPQIILLLAALAILLFALLSALTAPPLEIGPRSARFVRSVLRLGEGQALTADWSPDGHTIALGGSVGIWIRDTADLTAPPRLLEEHPGSVLSVAFNPAGTLLASGGMEGSVRLWDTRIWRTISVLEGHTDAVDIVLFSPDGRYLVTADTTYDSPTIRLWNAATRQIVLVIEPGSYATSIAFSPDSRYLAFVNADNVALLDMLTGEKSSLLDPSNSLSSGVRVAFDSQNRLIAGDSSRLKGIWLVEDGSATAVSGEYDQINPSLRAYLSQVNYNTVVAQSQPVETAIAQDWAQFARRSSYNHIDAIDVMPSPDGRQAAVEENTGWSLWNLQTPAAIAPLHTDVDSLYSVDFLENNAGAVATSGYATHIWKFDDGQHVSLDLQQAGGYVPRVLSRDEQALGLLVDWAGSVRLIDLTTGAVQHIFDGIAINDTLVFSDDDHYLATNQQDGSTAIWNLQTGALVSQITPDDPELRYQALAFSPDSRGLVTALPAQDHESRTIMFWDVATGQQIAVLGSVARNAWTAVFSPDGSRVVVGAGGQNPDHFGGNIKVWNVETGAEIGYYEGPKYNIQLLIISPDGRYVAGRSGSEVWLWDLQATPDRAALLALSPEDDDLRKGYLGVAFNPFSDLLAVGTARGDILLFDVVQGKQIAALKAHKDGVQDIAFSADGQMMVSTGRDGTVRVWRTDGHSPLRVAQAAPIVLPTLGMTATATPGPPPTITPPSPSA